jgi:hypothetical protein
LFSSSRCSRKTLAELNGELTHGGGPFDPSPPAHTGVFDGEVKQLERRIVVGNLLALPGVNPPSTPHWRPHRKAACGKNCTNRLSEQAEAGRKLHLSRFDSAERNYSQL